MKKLLALGATVLLSLHIVMVDFNFDERTAMFCNRPEEECNLGTDDKEYTELEMQELMTTIEPITEWAMDPGECLNVCTMWRVVRWMDYVTCVQIKVIDASKI